MRARFLRRCCALSAPFLFWGVLAAQTNRGSLSGTVFDALGAVVADATITIRNLGTNEVVEVKTSREGAYSALGLNPAVYSVTVTAPGFKTSTVDRVKVDTAQVATVNVTLEVGAVTANVTVEAAPAEVNLQSGTTGTTVTQRELTDIPLFNRSVLDLAVTQPNITGDAGSEDPSITASATVPGYNLSLNGGRPGSSLFLSDGVNNTGVSLARTMVSFSPETVQEFTVQTSAFSAEYGSTGGGIVNVTTKSGTNKFAGTALWYNRDPSFASPAWVPDLATTKPPPSNLKYNQFSVTAGGPVVLPKLYDGRNKTFWFAAYEPRYRRDLCNTCTGTYDLLPTDAMRAGDFSNTVMVRQPSGAIVRVPGTVAVQFGLAPGAADANIYNHYALVPGNQFTLNPAPTGSSTYPVFAYNGAQNVVPANLIDAAALKALAYIPQAGAYFLDPNGNIANVFSPRTLRQDEARYTVRVDHMFSPNNKVNGRYTHQPTVKTQFSPDDPTGASAEYSYSRQAMIDYTHVFTPRIFNDLRLDYTRGRFSTTVAPQYDVNTGQNLNTILGLPGLLHGGVPSLPFIGGQGSSSQDDTEERYGLSDILYLVRGNMNWKVGIDVSHSLQNETPLFDAIGGTYDIRALQTNSNGSSTTGTGGDAFASFLLGVVNGATFRPAILTYRYRWSALAAFAQNDWRIRPHLSLNLGLRYDLELPRTEAHDLQGVFRPDLAQSFPVPGGAINVGSGVTVPLTSIQVPAYALAGMGGRSRYLYPPSYLNFEPRFGFAWSPPFLAPGGRQMTVRGGYGISHLPISGTSRLPNPDFGFLTNYAGTPVNPAYVERLGENPPNVVPIDVNQAVFKNIPANGLLYVQPNGFGSLSMPGFAVSPNRHAPYSQNWNVTLTWEATPRTVIEVSYLGNKGTHLFAGAEDVNPRDLTLLSTLEVNGINTTGTGSGQGVVDPLQRRDAAGNPIKIQTGTLYSPYAGFPALFMLYDASASSSRHAATVYVKQRIGAGVMITSNYTYGKSIDDSQGYSDKFVLTTGQVSGQAAFGAPLGADRSVSTFDQTHSFNTSFIVDLPFGRERRFLSHSRGLLGAAVGGWTTSGILRVGSGYPAWATLVDSNLLGDPTLTHEIRPNLVPGVPLRNPLWRSSCPIGCEPFLNPEAFARPPLGQFGNAPRTFDSVRGPVEKYFDLSIQKNFSLGSDGKRRVQLRVDLLNAFNIPVFRVGPNQNFTDFMSAPNVGTINGTEYNTWARANSQPTLNLDANGHITDTSGQARAIYNGIVDVVNQNRNASGVLPDDFFTMQLPVDFHHTQPNAFDIRTLTGYKLWRLRNAYNTGFGTLYQSGLPRYIQIGLKIYF